MGEAAVPGGEAVPIRPAATLMVVRDGPGTGSPLEVLMVRRSLRSDFVGGAHVFPGGALDDADGTAEAHALCAGLTAADADATLDVDTGGLAYWVAAIRECFEEAGLLFASRTGDLRLSFSDPEDDPEEAARFARHRHEINSGRQSFLDVCGTERLTLAAGALHYFSHWITPEGANRRYDTRFFVTLAPPGQTPAHDAGETIAAVWIRPDDALAQHRAGTIDLVFPTVRSLQALGRFSTAAEVLAAAGAHDGPLPALLPRMVADGHGWRIVLPGDEEEPPAMADRPATPAVHGPSSTS